MKSGKQKTGSKNRPLSRSRGDTVKLLRAEYDALIERIEDLEDAAIARAAQERGIIRDALPVEALNRVLSGEHPIRIWREHRGLTMQALAERSKVPQSYISEIESGKKPGSVAALKKIAAALDLDLDDVAR